MKMLQLSIEKKKHLALEYESSLSWPKVPYIVCDNCTNKSMSDAKWTIEITRNIIDKMNMI